jgi:hypothetical protein
LGFTQALIFSFVIIPPPTPLLLCFSSAVKSITFSFDKIIEQKLDVENIRFHFVFCTSSDKN